MKKLELNKQEEFTLRAILSTINEMGNLQKICKDDNATEEALVSLCEKVFDGMDEFMKTKGFSPESSGGGCIWYLKKTAQGGNYVVITDIDGMQLPRTMKEPILAGLMDRELVEISCTEYPSLNEFF
ncbi:MAG: hypothetical protein JRJ69_15680, partial [Deltaproteobacteria bacterium]|nr:hypothetical protein [Deltaproteobacteria bacterium]